MSRLTIDQLMMLERLTGAYHTMSGKPRKYSRAKWEDDKIGMPQHHREWWQQKRSTNPLTNKLQQLLVKIKLGE